MLRSPPSSNTALKHSSPPRSPVRLSLVEVLFSAPAMLCGALGRAVALLVGAGLLSASLSGAALANSMELAQRACWMAAALGEPIRIRMAAHFDDSVGYDVLTIDGRDLSQPNKFVTAHLMCLFERKSGLAYLSSADTSSAAASNPSSSHVLSLPNGASVVVAEESSEPSASGSYSVRLYSDLSSGALVVGLLHPRAGKIYRVELLDVDGDGQPEVAVTIQAVDSARNAFLTRDVYKLYGTTGLEYSSRLSGRLP
jgi:Periplasmic lysozyme inhibitor of I-type lysozyme